MPAARRLHRRTLSSAVTDELRDLILQGELRAGERLNQEALAARLGVSTMPVREALLRLMHEGFVESTPSRTFRVLPIGRDDIADMYWVHGMLVAELARRAAVRMSRDELEALWAHQRLLEKALAAHDLEQMNRQSWLFHRALNYAARAPKLLGVLKSILAYLPTHFYPKVTAWQEAVREGHARILAALNEHDPQSAGQAAEQHIREIGDLLIGFFLEAGYWDTPGVPTDETKQRPSDALT